MGNENLIITPKTKILQLLEAYPQLEDVLIGIVPAFKKLKNPVLRKTVAKIASVQQAAAIGNVEVGDLINKLRKEVGQELFTDENKNMYTTEKPDWYDKALISKELDAREMLAAGDHPVAQVIADLKQLEGKSIFKLTVPFPPAPLIDKATSLEFAHWVVKESDDLFNIYFAKG